MSDERSTRWGQRSRRYLLALAVTLASACALSASLVTEGARELVWDAVAGPAETATEVAAGYTVVTVAAGPAAQSTLTVLRLHEGTTLEELRAAIRAIDEAFETGGDAAAAINAALELADVVGEVDADPEQRGSVGLVLEPGRYVLEHTPQPTDPDLVVDERSYHEFRVQGDAVATAPEPDATIQFVDFAFALPPDLPAGEQIWRVLNIGQQLHHMVIFSVPEGTTVQDFLGMMEQMGPPAEEGDEAQPPEPPEGVAPAGYVGIKSPGEESFHLVDLQPGTYMAVCFLPDHRGEQTGMPHFMLGMVQSLTVAGD